jgi:hypothetical protein
VAKKQDQLAWPFGPTTEPTITPTDIADPKAGPLLEGQAMGRPWLGITQPIPLHDITIPRFGHDLLKFLPTSRNPLVRLGMDTVSQGVFWSGWDIVSQVDAEEHPDWVESDTMMREDLESQIENLRECTFQDAMDSMLESARTYGVGVAELVWAKRGGGRGVDLVKIRHKWPYDFDFLVDGFDNLMTVRQTFMATVVNAPEIDSKLMIVPWPAFRGGNWYGTSDLLSIRHDVEAVEAIESAMVQGVQYLSIRPIIHFFEGKGMDPSQLNKIRSDLLKLDAGSVLSLPMQTYKLETKVEQIKQHEIKVLEDRASPEGIAQASKLRDMFAKRILNFLGIPDDLGMSAATVGVGSLAKAKAELSLLNSRVVESQNWLESAINRKLLPNMLRWNWARLPAMVAAGYKPPRLQFREIEEDKLLSMAAVMFDALRLGVVDLNTVQKRLDLPETEVAPQPIKPTAPLEPVIGPPT